MTCAACTAAKRSPRINEFEAGCMSCKGRALAAIGAHIESREAGAMTGQYKEALAAMFGADWKAGAAQVKAWATRMGQSDEPRASTPTKKAA